MSGAPVADAGVALELGELARAIAGELHGVERVEALRYSIDSRDVAPGAVFFALAGERTDGHAFLAEVHAKGAAAAVIRADAPAPPGLAVIRVADTALALAALGRHFRGLGSLRVIGITGSAGKTTTKEFTAALLSHRFRVFKSAGNFNTTIGLPLTLSRRRADDEVAVLEMGMSFPGELRRVSAIAEPDVAAITNVGLAHIEHFASADDIASAKAEILDHLRPGGVFVANADDPRVMAIAERFRGRVITFGSHGSADVRVAEVHVTAAGGTHFEVWASGRSREAELPIAGRHQVANVTAALAMARALGVDPLELVPHVAGLQAATHRGALLKLADVTVLDDCYNANPAAVHAALDTLAGLPGRRRVAILGDMRELGGLARSAHEATGTHAARVADVLLAVGAESKATADTARRAGLARVEHAGDAGEAARVAPTLIAAGDVVLVKGSRGVGLEVVVEAIVRACSPSS